MIRATANQSIRAAAKDGCEIVSQSLELVESTGGPVEKSEGDTPAVGQTLTPSRDHNGSSE